MSQVKRGRGRPKSYEPPEGSFAAQLARARRAAKMTQIQLAARIGVCEGTIKSWECERSSPNPLRRSRLADVLGVFDAS